MTAKLRVLSCTICASGAALSTMTVLTKTTAVPVTRPRMEVASGSRALPGAREIFAEIRSALQHEAFRARTFLPAPSGPALRFPASAGSRLLGLGSQVWTSTWPTCDLQAKNREPAENLWGGKRAHRAHIRGRSASKPVAAVSLCVIPELTGKDFKLLKP